jgi:ribosomal protein S1
LPPKALPETPSEVEKPVEFKSGQKLTGRVSRIELFGAFVDVGASFEGLVHISRLKPGGVARVQEAVQVGAEVEVWVERFDPASQRLELTMIRPVELKWHQIEPGLTMLGRVTRVERFGAFVDIGAERPGLVHVSEMDDGYVSDPGQRVKTGDEVEVSVLEVDRSKKQIRLTMKVVAVVPEDEEQEHIPTAMEVALREALQPDEKPPESAYSTKKSAPRKRKGGQLDDLLARTLSQRTRTSSAKEDQQ